MEYYSAIKNEDILSFAGKWTELENIILSEVTQTQKDMHGMWILAGEKNKNINIKTKRNRTEYPRYIQSTELKKLNKLKCPSEDTAVPRGKEEVWDVDQGREDGGAGNGIWGVKNKLNIK